MKPFRALLILAVIMTGIAFTVLTIRLFPWPLVIPLVALISKRKAFWSSAHGTARWADTADLQQAGMLDAKQGLILGRYDSEPPSFAKGVRALFNRKLSAREACDLFFRAFNRKRSSHTVRLANAVHVSAFAPTGVGKGVSVVVPHLLTCTDSMVIVDFKGELAKITAEARRKMGHRVVILDPYHVVTKEPDRFNPLDWIARDGETALDDCRAIAEAMVMRTGKEAERHWNDSAEMWIGSLCALVVASGEACSLQTVKALLSDPANLQAAVAAMCGSGSYDGMLARMGGQLRHFRDRELASVITTTARNLAFLDTPLIAESTRVSTFNPAELNSGRMTVYLVLPPDQMRSQSPLLRLWVGAMMRAVVKGGLGEHRKVQFALDEAATLGQMDSLADAINMGRGYGVRLLFIYQSVGQLKKCWPDGADQTFLSNVSQLFFGVNDNETAKYVSDRLGEYTVAVDSGGTSSGRSRQANEADPQRSVSVSQNENSNWSQIARKLLKPEEVQALDKRIAITFTAGIPPIWTTLARYYEGGLEATAGFWSGVRIAGGATACFFLSILLLLATTATAGKLR